MPYGKSGYSNMLVLKKATTNTCFTLLAIILMSCGTLKNGNSQVPRLYEHVPNIQGVYWGFGHGSNLRNATVESIIDISYQVYSEVNAELIRRMIIIDENGEVSKTEDFEQKALLKTYAILTNAKRLQYRTSTDGDVYALSYVKIDNAAIVDEQQIVEEIKMIEKKDKLIKSSMSVLLPGTGHMMNGQYAKGGLLLSVATSLSIGTFLLINEGYNAYDEYKRAPDPIAQEIYRRRAIEYFIGALIGGVAYIVEGVVCVVDLTGQY